MALSEKLLYSTGLAAVPVLLFLFAIPSAHLDSIFRRVEALLPTWLSGKSGKEYVLHVDSPEILSDEVSPTAIRYPSSWWTDKKLYQLERRANFSKKWLYVTHTSRFQKPGDYRTFEIFGFSIVVILDKDWRIRAFHNVCRHRAYAVTKKACGSSIVLGCRYHGWSYDTKGKLIKAPEFEDVKGFEKEMNGLWEVSVEVRGPMVFVNFNTGTDVELLQVGKHEKEIRKYAKSECIAEWTCEGAFNWKLAAGELTLTGVRDASGPSWRSFMMSWLGCKLTPWDLDHATKVQQLPNGTMILCRLLPASPITTKLECTVFSRNSKRSRSWEPRVESLRSELQVEINRVELMQRELLNGSGSFMGGKQEEFNSALRWHLQMENQLGTDIHPAARKQGFTDEGKSDDNFCIQLESSLCGLNEKGLLDW